MSKHNINDSARGFYYADSGNDAWDGGSVETPKKTISGAIASTLALIPPPGAGNLATVNEAQGGLYFEDLVVPDYVLLEGAQSAVITTGLVGIQLGSQQGFRPQAAISNTDNASLLLADGIFQHGTALRSITLGGANAIGIDIQGMCSALFFTVSETRLNGIGSTLVKYTGQSEIDSDFNLNTVELDADNAVFFEYSPSDPGDTADINISSLHVGESAPIGTKGLIVNGGILKVRAGSLVSDMAVDVGVAGTLTVSANVIAGKTYTDGAVVYDTVGVVFGDYETSATGSISWRGTSITGNLINAGEMSIICTTVDGQITNTGQMYVQIANYTGVLPANDGSINGIINGIRYGNEEILYEHLLRGASFANQNPVGTDNPLQIEFGAAQPPLLDVAGTFIAPDNGQYEVTFFIQYGRTGAGGVSWMLFYMEVDGFQAGNTALAKLDGANDDLPNQFIFTLDLTVGQEVKAYIVRDSQGNDSGGLLTESPTLALNDVASASIAVERIKNS